MYDWRDDIKYVSGALRSDNAFEGTSWDIENIIDQVSRNIVDDMIAEDPHYYDDIDIDDAVNEQMKDFMPGGSATIWCISPDSRLFELLLEWYDTTDPELMMDSIRQSIFLDEYDEMFFVTGCGYDVMSADLLGGSSDGVASREFDRFVEERMS